MFSRTVAAAALLSSLALAAGESRAASLEAVTTCGQVLEKSGYLVADLDCSGENIDAHTVTVGPSGTLDLAGFTLTGRTTSTSVDNGYIETVACQRKCTILGPGTIVGSPTGPGSVVGFDTWEDGKRVNVVDATLTGGAIGVNARRVYLDGATITANRNVGVWAFQAYIEGSTITDNGLALEPFTRYGVFGQVKSVVRDSTVTGNGMCGVEGWRVYVENSTVTGNNAHPDCATKVCADLASRFAMRVDAATTCDTSLDQGTVDEPGDHLHQPLSEAGVLSTWGVCALD